MMAQSPTSFEWHGEAGTDVPAGTYPILGHGLWGPTLDLRDGTLLKLVRGDAGIGDGREINANEARVLSLLGGRPLDDIAIPRLIAHGDFLQTGRAGADGYAAWLRLTRVAGRPIDEDWLAALAGGERDRFAVSFGTAAASLRCVATALFRRKSAALDDRLRSLLTSLPAISSQKEDAQLGMRLRDAVDVMPESRRGGFIHGDLHLQNILVDDHGRVCGVIDFGEAGQGFPEVDLVYLHWLPSIEPEVLRAYQEAADPVDQTAYHLAGAIYALTAAVISERHGDAEGAAAERRRLAACLRRMGWSALA
jgi:Phosphotransferase enzyme family